MSKVYWLIKAQDRLEEAASIMYCGGRHCSPQDGPRGSRFVVSGASCKEKGFADLAVRLGKKLEAAFADALIIVVTDCLLGYTAANGKFVLRVEVTEPAASDSDTDTLLACKATCGEAPWRPRAYVVKVAYPRRNEKEPRELLGAELRGWEACKRRGNERGRIFMHLKPGHRSAGDHPGWYDTLKYEDAHQVLRAAEVVTLEEAVLASCQWGRPPAESVEDAITQVYHEMSDRFYKRSWSQAAGSKASVKYWKKRVEKGLETWIDRKSAAGQCRDEALCLLSGLEKDFLDPCNYMEELWKDASNVPELQRGCSHGDLHGRNVLIGLLDGEAKWPAVFDYEDMGCGNYLGLDFVKLETELKVRALPRVLSGSERAFVRAAYRFEVALGQETEKRNNAGVWERETLASVSWKDALAIIQQADPGDGLPPRPAGAEKQAADATREAPASAGPDDVEVNEDGLHALWIILLGVRRMARMCLETHRGRNRRWLDEYYFLLMCYGVYSGKFSSYAHREFLGAFVCNGVAAYRFAWRRELRGKLVKKAEAEARKALADNEVRDHVPDPDVPCPFAETAFAKEYARSRRHDFVKKALAMFQNLHAKHPQLVDVAHELVFAMLEMAKVEELAKRPKEAGQFTAEAARLTKEFEDRYRGVDPEMLARVGRIWKEGAGIYPNIPGKGMPPEAVGCFREAVKHYGKAYQRGKDPDDRHYYGINVATCLWLSGEEKLAHATAGEVLRLLRKLGPAKDRKGLWRLASQAEATLLLGKVVEARRLYEQAAQDPDCPEHACGAMRDQVNRILRKPPDQDRKLKPGDLDSLFLPPEPDGSVLPLVTPAAPGWGTKPGKASATKRQGRCAK